MIFASDLDRTLIYSRGAIGEDVGEADLVPVELYEGRQISFMTKSALHLLEEITKIALFVPVTTRTVRQYKRIFHLLDVFQPKYAITSNGGTVLIDGVPDVNWSRNVQLALKESSSPEEAKLTFDRFRSSEWIISERLADNFFYSIVVDRDKFQVPLIDECRSYLKKLGWTISVQGRKVYLIPEGINKGNAVNYVKELAGARYVAASGDSLLDESLLRVSHYSLSPSHGELFNTKSSDKFFRFTKQSGIQASEELVIEIHKWFKSLI
ncbi:HAD family hydrolase [Paenibacillus durus]|uniref:Sucrose phosphatase-like domain-containing protein n=1 Tax=Paenibacillus durus ATCC 35681 TaxID=1333534 RepID=A0A0F7CH00_PAEDU|nr:HAD family hydrolase [Paenibacillus durus]AKG33360.1 hypothetical protein VK70_00995 [Paenibacillus durus ATCC 35681]